MKVSDRVNKPTIHGIQIPGRRGRLFSILYTAGGPGPHPVVLLLHGIPGNEQNLDLAQELRRNGFHVLTFHYSGCFGSDGNYSLSHNVEDANSVLDFIENTSEYDFDKDNIYAVGHSMGGFVCAHLAASRPEIRGIVLLMPCDAGRIWKISEENPAAAQVILDILEESSLWLRGASKEKFVEELLLHRDTFPLENLAGQLSCKPLLLVEAVSDICTAPEYHCQPLVNAIASYESNRIQVLRFETDHFASDCRIELIDSVVSYLRGIL